MLYEEEDAEARRQMLWHAQQMELIKEELLRRSERMRKEIEETEEQDSEAAARLAAAYFKQQQKIEARCSTGPFDIITKETARQWMEEEETEDQLAAVDYRAGRIEADRIHTDDSLTELLAIIKHEDIQDAWIN